MAIRERDLMKKAEIDLRGPGGNAYSLLAQVKHIGSQLDYPQERIKEIQTQMMASDYENLIKVFDEEFGDYVDLIKA